ncbi:hypothetical protein GCM10007863_09840 [Dyella mobilis]|nr:hypothetical protein GCM10007863_09840 [Dyella mobilis]
MEPPPNASSAVPNCPSSNCRRALTYGTIGAHADMDMPETRKISRVDQRAAESEAMLPPTAADS